MNNFMKEIVFDHIIKVWKGFKHFLNFLKFPCGAAFASASDACRPPFGFGSKFLNYLKHVFLRPK